MTFRVSVLDGHDAAAAAEFYAAQQQQQPDVLRPRTPEEFETFAGRGCLYGVRRQDGALVATGFMVGPGEGSSWEVGGFAVDEDARKAGVGTALARFALSHLIATKRPRPESIFADVRTGNPKPRGPLEAIGFTSAGQATHHRAVTDDKGRGEAVVTDRFRFGQPGLNNLAAWLTGLSTATDGVIRLDFGSLNAADIERELRAIAAASVEVQMADHLKRPNRLQTLMMGLVYPAFFGTFLVSFGLSSGTLGADQKTLAVFLLIYFMAAYVETQTAYRRTYSVSSLAGDGMEVGLMAALFIMAGVATLDVGLDIPVLRRDSPSHVWVLLAALFAIPPSVRTVVYRLRIVALDGLCLVGMALAVSAAFRAFEWLPWQFASVAFRDLRLMTTRSDLIGLGGVWILLAIYLLLAVGFPSALKQTNLQSIWDGYTKAGVVVLVAAAFALWVSAS